MTAARLRPLAAVAALALAAAAGAEPPGGPAAASAGPPIDWAAARDATARLLAGYVRVDTSNPPGNELAGARYVADWLAREGIAAQVFESAPGRGNVCARLPASAPDGRGAILLLHHLDVVPAEAEGWSAPPFAGEVRDGHLWGRGAIDDKGHGAIQMMALALLARSGAPRARDLVLCGTAAEETRGEDVGVDWMLARHLDALGPPAAVWNEGGGAARLPPLGARTLAGIAVSEKRGLWLTLVAEGPGGHGSQPLRDSAPLRLARALGRIDGFATPVRVPGPVAETLARLSGALDFPWSWLARLARHPFALRLASPWLDRVPLAGGFVRDTIALTGMKSGFKHNVIPTRAEATLDVRLLPETDPAQLLAALSAVIADPHVRIETGGALEGPLDPSPWDHELFHAIEAEVAAEWPGALTVPVMMPAGTDSKFFRERGIPAYGFVPAVLDAGLTAAIHGTDERIPLEALETGVRVTYRTLVRLVAPVR